jgi:DNA uptake protein ComE-like DNA-binding protein
VDLTAVKVFQDKRSGKRVRLVGGINEKEPFVMVVGNDNQPYYAEVSQLAPCDEAGRPDRSAVLSAPTEAKEETPPVPVIDLPETRLNLNLASAQEISSRIPGVGYRTAKRIVEQRLSLPGERFTTLEQVQSVSNRVNWEEVLKADLVFVA